MEAIPTKNVCLQMPFDGLYLNNCCVQEVLIEWTQKIKTERIMKAQRQTEIISEPSLHLFLRTPSSKRGKNQDKWEGTVLTLIHSLKFHCRVCTLITSKLTVLLSVRTVNNKV